MVELVQLLSLDYVLFYSLTARGLLQNLMGSPWHGNEVELKN